MRNRKICLDKHFLGGPTAASSESLARAMGAAKRLADSQKSRHPGNFSKRRAVELITDTDFQESEEESEGLELWKLLPHLKDVDESLLKKLPISAVFQLNNALAKEQKSSERLGVNTKLAHNAKKLARNPVAVEEGHDNRRDILHSARFLGGASSSLAEQWGLARKIIGEAGVVPLGNYDLDSVGCGGCVTPKGWLEIHNPASQELKLKLFHMPNMAGNGQGTKRQDGEDGESLKEIADLDSYRVALNTAREAMASALPWNRSISALVGLMLNTNYLAEDLGGNPKRAAILTEFTDYVFGRNGLSWENKQAFLTTDELTHVWANWRTKRGISSKPHEKRDKKDGFTDKKKQLSEICRLFNAKTCKHQQDKDCKSTWGKTLKHVCNKFMGGGKLCMKDHPRIEHQ